MKGDLNLIILQLLSQIISCNVIVIDPGYKKHDWKSLLCYLNELNHRLGLFEYNLILLNVLVLTAVDGYFCQITSVLTL